MAISRAQLEQQIQNLEGGGGVEDDEFDKYASGTGVKPLDTAQLADPVQEEINSMNAALKFEPESELQPQMSFEQRFQNYKDRLNPLISGQNQRPRRNFYDMASTLGAAILSSDPTEGLYRGLGRGFAAFNQQLSKDADELRAEQRQIGLKAFEMAQADERSATDYLQRKELEILKNKNKGRKYVTWSIPEIVDGKATGNFIQRSAAETDLALQEQFRSLGGFPAKTSGTNVTVGGNTGDSAFLKDVGKGYAKAVAGWGTEAQLARTTQNQLDQAIKIQEGLGYDDVGKLASITLDARKILSELGFISGKNITDQEVLQALGTRISMGLIGQTKGAISNSEMELFLASSPGLSQTKDGFNKLVNYLSKINKMSIDFNSAYNKAVMDGEFNEAFASGNDAVIGATIGAWQSGWHERNPLFPDSAARAEAENFAKSENPTAIKFRTNYAKPSDNEAVDNVEAQY